MKIKSNIACDVTMFSMYFVRNDLHSLNYEKLGRKGLS